MQDANFAGVRIIANRFVPETVSQQYRFPRSKKKRIRKKWARNPKYRREVMAVFQVDGVFMVHPKMYAKLMDRFQKKVNEAAA